MNDDSKRIFAKLSAYVALNKAKVLADPEPYIEMLHNQNARLLNMLHSIENALHSDFVYNAAADLKLPPEHFKGQERLQLQKIQQSINDFREGN